MFRFISKKKPQKPDGKVGVEALGHRVFVGGKWNEIGRLQFEFLKHNGLTPDTCLLDIGCGSLRAGVHIINYLNTKKYLGLDKENELIRLGIEKELGIENFKEKLPEFIISNNFDFSNFSSTPQISIAQSLFTHLTNEDIELCLKNLYNFTTKGHTLYCTFFIGDSKNNASSSHSHDCFFYSYKEIENIATKTLWEYTCIGDWGHPRGQIMFEFTKQ